MANGVCAIAVSCLISDFCFSGSFYDKKTSLDAYNGSVARCKFYACIVGSRRHRSSCHLLEFLTLSQIKMRCRESDALHRNDEITSAHGVIRTGLGKQLAVKLVIYIQLARGRRGSNITEISIPQSRDTIRDADGGQAGILIVSIIS